MKKQNRLAALLASVALVAGSLAMVACSSPVDSTPPVVETSISSVSIDKEYFVGDTVEKSDFTVKVKKGASTKTITADEFSVEVPTENLDANGKLKRSSGSTGRSESVKCTIKYEDLTKTKTITVNSKPNTITVTPHEDFPTEYYVGEEIDLSKVTVTAGYEGDENPEDVTSSAKVSGNPTETAGNVELIISVGGVEAEPIAITVIPYDGGLVTKATATGTDTAAGIKGNLYRGFQFTNSDKYVEDQWAVQTNIVTDADLEAGKYYKISFGLVSTVNGQSTIVNVCSDGEQFYSKKFTTNATNNQIELKIAPTEAVENVGIDIGHGWTPGNRTFTIKNLKIEEVDISAATEMTLTASEDSFGSTATATFTATVMGFDVRPVYTVKSETASSDSSVEDDGTFVFGTFNEGKTESAVTVKATFNGIEAEKTVTVKMLKAFNDTAYTWSNDVAASTTWTYETTNKNIGIYSSVGATAQFSTDGTAVKYTNTNPNAVWQQDYATQIAIGAFNVGAGDTYRISFKAFFATNVENSGEFKEGSNELESAFVDVREYSRDVVAVPNEWKNNEAEATICFNLGFMGQTNTVTIYDIEVEKIASYTVTGIAITPATTSADTLKKGKTQQFVAKDTGTLGAERTVEWSVTPATAGTITEAGKFTAGEVAEDTVVTITAKYSETISATTQITVLAPSGEVVPYTATLYNTDNNGAWFRGTLTWDSDDYALTTGSKISNCSFDAPDGDVSNPSIENVNGNTATIFFPVKGAAFRGKTEGKLTFRLVAAVKTVDVEIIYTDSDVTATGSTTVVNEVTVTNVAVITPSETKVSFDSASADAVEVTMTSEGFTASSYSAISSNTEVATVSVSGNKVTITPVADGDAVVTVTADGKTAEIKVHVGAIPPLGLDLSTSLNLSTLNIINVVGWNGADTQPTKTTKDEIDVISFTLPESYGWAGAFWQGAAIDVSMYTKLVVTFNDADCDKPINKTIVKFEDGAGASITDVFEADCTRNGNWVTFEYPLSKSDRNMANITVVGITNWAVEGGNPKGKIYISDVHFE